MRILTNLKPPKMIADWNPLFPRRIILQDDTINYTYSFFFHISLQLLSKSIICALYTIYYTILCINYYNIYKNKLVSGLVLSICRVKHFYIRPYMSIPHSRKLQQTIVLFAVYVINDYFNVFPFMGVYYYMEFQVLLLWCIYLL